MTLEEFLDQAMKEVPVWEWNTDLYVTDDKGKRHLIVGFDYGDCTDKQ